MGLMGVMMVGMIVFTSLSAKRQLKKQEEEEVASSDVKVNPYKVAKVTGKAVEDVVAKTEKEKEKARAQAQKKKGKIQSQEKTTVESDTEQGKDTQRVTGPRPVSATGSTYITGRKEKAEKERELAAAKAAAGTTRPKAATGKSKNKKANKK
jgi:homospermidine synthase